MLSSDRSERRADQGRRRTRRAKRAYGADETGQARDRARWAESFNPIEPWDAHSAEILTRLYESEEGTLWRPAGGDRRRSHAHGETIPGEARVETDTADRTWLEEHLSRLVERLQEPFIRYNPEASIAALRGRIEHIEQRFGSALGRVAQRVDLESLQSIEAHVVQLAAQLEHARDRLEQIGAVDQQVHALAQRLDEAGEQRAHALEKLLRDCIGEWREAERRTAGALHSLEEAVARLGDTVDAMEASKPAPELTLPALVDQDLEGDVGVENFQLDAGGQTLAPQSYHAMLDATDYAPRPSTEGATAARHGSPAATGLVEQAPAPSSPSLTKAGVRLTPGALRIMAMRAKLRQATTAGSRTTRSYPSAGEAPRGALKRVSLSLLLMVGAASLAGGTYVLYEALTASAPTAHPIILEPRAHPSGLRSDRTDPTGWRTRGESAGLPFRFPGGVSGPEL
jgi:hypothetical protein